MQNGKIPLIRDKGAAIKSSTRAIRFRLRSTCKYRELSGVETRSMGILFARKSLTAIAPYK